MVFYKTYPRRQDRAAALTAWQRALKLATEEEILQGARKYAEERAKIPKEERMKYTKLPATWLNNRCWQDYDKTNDFEEEESPLTSEELYKSLGYRSAGI